MRGSFSLGSRTRTGTSLVMVLVATSLAPDSRTALRQIQLSRIPSGNDGATRRIRTARYPIGRCRGFSGRPAREDSRPAAGQLSPAMSLGQRFLRRGVLCPTLNGSEV
jgi:hypothetical protein